MKVSQVKEQISQKHSDFSVESTKLVCAGKVLENDKSLKELKLKDCSFIVILDVKKSDAKPCITTAPAAASAATTNSPSLQDDFNSDFDPSLLVESSSQREQILKDLTDMGFDRRSVMMALRASFYNPDRAVEYLLSGNIPQNPEINHHTSDTSQPQSSSVQSSSQLNSSAILQSLRAQPQFRQLREVIRQNPDMLTTVISQIGQEHPELLDVIQENEDEFLQMLTEESSPSDNEQVPQTSPNDNVEIVRLTRDERAAIDRLKELGFSETSCLQAYFACEKNENDAANFLFNANLDDNEDEDIQ
ncbi:hypothetical protein GJ496_001611 [Pomphorhynchus laevis]|nr:hypothetical protein GJ496_010894 [Pomphorhynchus laevis]KAI0990488.1 hypothetical protein GJ496_001611 [Pomphorhynchus laevis]